MSAETIQFRPGRKAPHPDTPEFPRLRLGRLLKPAELPAVPPIVDWVSLIEDWPMFANDAWGDCVFAMIGHSIQAATRYGQGATVTLTDDDILAAYSAVTGFDINAGPPGSNPTDNGTVIQDALNYWRKEGIGGHKILAFGQLDHENPTEIMAALHLFGHVQLGINFPASAMDQFNAGQPWDVVKGSPIEGGHAINLGYSKNDRGRIEWEPISWARLLKMSPEFLASYVEEAWAVITPEWLDAVGNSPEGIDMASLGGAFVELTDEPNPFPVAA